MISGMDKVIDFMDFQKLRGAVQNTVLHIYCVSMTSEMDKGIDVTNTGLPLNKFDVNLSLPYH